MRQEITQIIAEYEIKIAGNKKALEIADEKIPTSEKIIYIGPSNITITPRNTNAPKIRTGVIAITDKNIYVVHKALWESGLDVFPLNELELVSYRASGISGATFDMTLSNVSISFMAGYKKEYAEKLNSLLSALVSSGNAQATGTTGESDALVALEKLAGMKEKGIISDIEFEEKKKELLSRV